MGNSSRCDQLQGRRELDRVVQCSVQWAVHRIQRMRALRLLSSVLGCNETHRDMNPADDQHSILFFHLTCHIRGELAVTGINLARFQRASTAVDVAAYGRIRGRQIVCLKRSISTCRSSLQRCPSRVWSTLRSVA